MRICGIEVAEWDHIRLTGTCSSPSEAGRLENFEGIIGAVSPASVDDDGTANFAAIKLWPIASDGKFWFPVSNIESLTMIEKDSE